MHGPIDNHLMPITPRPACVMERGEGSWLWDEAGNRYLDFIQGWAVNALGHTPPEIRAALARQAATLLTPSPALHNRPQLDLAKRLTELSGMDQVFFCNSGTEAVEGAIKLARKWGRLGKAGAHEIITTENAFHGRTLAAMAASGKPGWDALFPPNLPGFVKVPFGDVAAVERAMSDRTAAVMVEPIQGEAGAVAPPDGYLSSLRALTLDRSALLILDEIQTGLGRTGALFAYEHEGVAPDVLTLGKGLGGGVPLAAVLASGAASCFEHGDQGGTYNGNPLMTAVGLAVLDTVACPAFLESVRARADALRAGLTELVAEHGHLGVRGRGLLLGVVLSAPTAEALRDACFDHGLIINASRPDVLRFMPSLRVTAAEIDQALAILDAAMREAH